MNTKPPLVFSYMRVNTWQQIKGHQQRCIIYARSACTDEADPLLNRQVELCKKLIADKDWIHCRTILEPGVSGTKLNRPGLFELLSEIMRGTADVVVVTRRDRLSNSVSDLTAIEASIEVNGGLVVTGGRRTTWSW